jgi:fatty-acyl-CoA synthase
VREAPEKVRTSARLSQQTGMLWSMTPPGVMELLRVFASGSQNPSLIYRVQAKNSPSKPAIIWRGRTTSWAELDERIDRLASGLERRGIGRGKKLVLMMRNRQELVELGAATARARAAAVTISWRSTAKELAFLATHSGARGIVLEAELMPALEEARPELSEELLRNVFVVGADRAPAGTTRLDALLEEPAKKLETSSADEDEAAVVIYTSGTTGKPKGAVRKFPKDTMQAAFRFINETPMRVDDVHLVACPLYHSTAFGVLSLSHILGCTVVLMDHFDAKAWLELVDQHGVTTTAMVPTMLQRVLDVPLDLRKKVDTRSLRAVFSGGAPLAAPVALDFMDALGDGL